MQFDRTLKSVMVYYYSPLGRSDSGSSSADTALNANLALTPRSCRLSIEGAALRPKGTERARSGSLSGRRGSLVH